MSAPDRRAKLERGHQRLSIRRQCAVLGIARSGVYRLPRPVNDDDAANPDLKVDVEFIPSAQYVAKVVLEARIRSGATCWPASSRARASR